MTAGPREVHLERYSLKHEYDSNHLTMLIPVELEIEIRVQCDEGPLLVIKKW